MFQPRSSPLLKKQRIFVELVDKSHNAFGFKSRGASPPPLAPSRPTTTPDKHAPYTPHSMATPLMNMAYL